MRFGNPDRWVILRLDADKVVYRDDRGNKARARLDSPWLPPKIDALVGASVGLAESERQRLPVFLQSRSTSFPHLAVEIGGSPSLKAFEHSYQFVLLPSRRHVWTPFAMPLRIAAIGSAVERIASFSGAWFMDGAQTANGFRIDRIPSHRIGSIADDVDVVVANEVDALTVLYLTMAGATRPRLVIAAAEQTESSLQDLVDRRWTNDAALRTSSLLFLPPEAAGRTHEALFDLLHDRPLHEIAARLRTQGSPWQQPLLVSDPRALHSLRISDALAAAVRDELAQRLAGPVVLDMRGGGLESHIVNEPPSPVLHLRLDFTREGSGFVPLTRAVSDMAINADILASSSAARGFDETPQRRRVDARIERVENAPLDLFSAPAADVIWVPPNRTLRNGGRYRLRIQIGRDFPGNLVSASVPDLDSLLPPTKERGWELDIVVFGKDFRLHAHATQKLWLGRTGASEPLYFDIQAPAQGTCAELRFAVYHGNHLLQSFLLTAALTPQEVVSEKALQVTLDMARSDAFANLDELGPRALSIGVNLDADGAHRLLIKFDEIGRELRIENSVVDQPLNEFRKAINAVAVKDNKAIFPAEGPSMTAAQQAAFETTIRELARIGRKLHEALFDRGGHGENELRAKFKNVRKNGDWTLQFTRYDPNFVMPWAIFYDYALPTTPGLAAICDGTNNGAPCGHGPHPGVICINGFWGMRHVVEEQLAGGGASNSVRAIERPKSCAPICIADGVGDGSAKSLETTLKTSIGPTVVSTVASTQKVLDDILWQAAARPAVMMLLGHLDETGPARRIQIPGTNQWLTASDISQYALDHDDWAQPNSLVLLMACGAMQASSKMLHDHALALHGAGAAAIVGPECPVSAPFACRVARDILLDMLKNGLPLGQALTNVRRELATAHIPLGFAFTAFGDTDVTIA